MSGRLPSNEAVGIELSAGGFEGHSSLLSRLSEGNAELEELEDDIGEIFEEQRLISSILLDVLLEGLVRDKGHVGRKHHESLGRLILILGCELITATI